MTLSTALDLIIDPTLAYLGPPYNSPKAQLLLLAIAQTESGWRTRQQVGGPARGFWQFELGGGCTEFATARGCGFFRNAARNLQLPTEAAATWSSIGTGADTLACIMARAILWLDPAPLPDMGDRDGAYAYYLRRWRPGKPSKGRWDIAYAAALTECAARDV